MAEITITPAEFAEKWARRMSQAGPDIERGVNAVSEAPGIKAAAAQSKMRSNLLAAIDDGTWALNVSAVPLADWKQAMIQKGLGRISQGVEAAKGKVQDVAAQLLEHERRLQADINRMPGITIADSRNRMMAWFDGMVEFKIR